MTTGSVREFEWSRIVTVKRIGTGGYILVPAHLRDRQVKVTVELLPDDEFQSASIQQQQRLIEPNERQCRCGHTRLQHQGPKAGFICDRCACPRFELR